MRLCFLLLTGTFLAGPSEPAFSQAYKCGTADRPIYQQTPCIGGEKLKTVPDPPNPTTLEGRIELAVSRRQVFIGMPQQDVVRSWGRPTKNNKTTTSRSVHEQWVYDRGRIGDTQYLYFENGILRSIQSPE